jgi:hypothetical protein
MSSQVFLADGVRGVHGECAECRALKVADNQNVINVETAGVEQAVVVWAEA